MSKKMTALEWFFQRLIDSGVYLMSEELEFYEQAKQMEKEQILDARLDGFKVSGEGYNGEYPFEGEPDNIISDSIENEQYYNETYKSE